jgi:peptidyl-prolyl cis-trans isomerase SurA
MHKTLVRKVLTSLIISCALSVSGTAGAQTGTADRIEAVVNNGVILESDLDAAFAKYKKRVLENIPAGQSAPDDLTLRKHALEQLINASLVTQLGEKMGVQISDMETDQLIESVAKMSNRTVNQVYEDYFKNDGLTPLQTREKIKKEALISELQHISVRKRVRISNQEIEQTMELLKQQNNIETKYDLASIFLRVDDHATAEEVAKIEELAKQIVQRVRNGEKFSALAMKYSQDPKAAEGGNWGQMNINSMPTVFLENVSHAKKGDLIGPNRTDAGYIIILVKDIQGTAFQPDISIKTRHILIKPTLIVSDEQVVEKLRGLRKAIENGSADFADLARKYSEDPGTSVKGGEIDWSNPKIFDPIYAKTALSLKPGEISEPFKSSFGWHIVQLIDKKIDTNSNSELKDRAYQMLFDRRYNDELILWLNELRNNSYIKIIDPQLSGGADAQQ